MAKETGKEIEERRTDSFLRDILDNLDQYAFGIITQHGYRELEAKLDTHAQDIETRFHRWFIRGLVAFGIMALGVTLGLVGYGVLLGKQHNVDIKQSHLLQSFKETRKSFVRDSCTAQNKRHDKTVAKLNKGINQAKKQHPERIRQLKQSKKFTIGLIDSLAPVQDCVKLAEVSVGDAKPPPPDIKRSP